MKTKALKNSLRMNLIWILVALLASTGATYAWFTYSTTVNVTPIEGTISNSGTDILISNSYGGPFLESCELLYNTDFKGLRPVSTVNLVTYYKEKNSALKEFVDATGSYYENVLTGTFYIKSEGGESDIYFNPATFYISCDNQTMAALRVGFIFQTEHGDNTLIFRADDFLTGNDYREDRKHMQDGVVVASINNNIPTYSTDPSHMFSEFCAQPNNRDFLPGTCTLARINDGEIITVTYFLYLEGCDINCVNEVMDNTIGLSFGFAGIPLED